MSVKIFYDLETTGTDPKKHCIHQMSGLVEVDGEVAEHFNWYLGLHPKAKVEKEALGASGVTLEDLKTYPDYRIAFREFTAMMKKYINNYEPKE